ncbi:transposase, IS605 OrfB family, central region [Nonomuraea wenchangensis]|uniref:Transposase, IS605 OrfB family, central region n=1 Tax=Nonomuraea wenchangensis TaxID=568860 RepID=A0A1I0LDI4_9ACTN|nr:transposase, IS605 OrfB family, central region [Nonomuraea wenchangensis]
MEATLDAANRAANLVAALAFQHHCFRNFDLRKHAYDRIKAEFGLAVQAAQHVIKKVCDAYRTLHANLAAGHLGKPGSSRRAAIEARPISFRPPAAQPYDDRCLSWQHDARTVSIWTTAGRLKGVTFTGSARQLALLAAHRRGESDLVCRAKSIVTEAERTGRGIALEDLQGIRERVRLRKPQRVTLHSWSFHQFGAFIADKAVRAGVAVILVDAACTSQQCSHCGHADKRNRPDPKPSTARSCKLGRSRPRS